jgi:hypothetical protein
LSGLIAAGIGLSHTVEVYTAAIGLPFILAANWRRIQWPRLARDLILASGVALALFLPYASAALSWAHGGGAVANGAATGSNADGRLGLSGGLGFLMLDVLAGFVGDAPIRLMLLAVGTWSALRTPNGRALLALSAAFLVLPLTLVYVDVQPVQWLFAVTFPWSHGYRLLMVASLWLAMLGGAGAVSMAERLLVAGRSAVWIRLARRCALLVGTLAAVGAVVLVPLRLTIDGAHDSVFLADDAAAFTWLAAHVHAGELIANDWSSDAGIWLPYKTGGKILFPRFDAGANIPERLLVADDLSGLEASPDGQEAACGLGVRYVYVGASTSSFWDAHRFPSRDQLRQSAALEEVFTSGQASVFRVRVDCPGAST